MINYWVYSYFVINIYKVTVLVNLQIHRSILRKGQIRLHPKHVLVKGQPCAFYTWPISKTCSLKCATHFTK